jgi:5'-nucleotidase
MKKIIVVNRKRLEKKIEVIKKDGLEKFFVLSDFDGTLTKVFYRGKKRSSLISVLRSEKYLGENYSQKANALYEKYHSIEINPKVPLKNKNEKMEEWWRTHYKLLKEFGLKKSHLKRIIVSEKINLREKSNTFFNLLKEKSVPLIIFSSGGLGVNLILMFLKKEEKLFDNVFLVGNVLKWDKKGKFIGIKEPVIHSLNKKGKIIKKFPEIFEKIKKRQNVLILGNDIKDLLMIEGLNIKNSIKIGFLNNKTKESLKNYKKYFDILILNDGTMQAVNEVLKNIVKKKI